MIKPTTNAQNIYPKMNPPLGLKIMPIPPANPEKTGMPVRPISTKIIWLKVARLAPIMPAAVNMAKWTKLIGAGPIGIDTCDKTALNAAKRAHSTISFVWTFFIKNSPCEIDMLWWLNMPNYFTKRDDCQPNFNFWFTNY
jgi:hypothetical protein